ncbi:hypothetical protein BH10PSE17_BH10PSE17_08290 [soil metagenome]
MRVLFVHGMGRSPISGWPMLRHLSRAGLDATTFGYFTSIQSFDAISARLTGTLTELLRDNDLALVGHSLGGLLLRDALRALPVGGRQPHHLFLLGSPIGASSVAGRLAGNAMFRAMTGDCGRMLGSSMRMSGVKSPSIPTTGIAGVRALPGRKAAFGGQPNDGVVTLAEVSAPWLRDQEQVPIIHTLLPSSRRVASIILQRLGRAP